MLNKKITSLENVLYVFDNLRWVDEINLINNLLITCQYIQFICSLWKASVSSKRLKYFTQHSPTSIYIFSDDSVTVRRCSMESPAKRQKVLSSIQRTCIICSKQTSETYLTKGQRRSVYLYISRCSQNKEFWSYLNSWKTWVWRKVILPQRL